MLQAMLTRMWISMHSHQNAANSRTRGGELADLVTWRACSTSMRTAGPLLLWRAILANVSRVLNRSAAVTTGSPTRQVRTRWMARSVAKLLRPAEIMRTS